MDFTFSEAELAGAELTRTILDDFATNERLREIGKSEARYDADLWAALAKADVLGLGIPERDGGSGLGFLALCLVLEEVGKAVAPVPAYATLALGALPIARFGDDALRGEWLPKVISGEAILTAALNEYESSDPLAPRARVDGGTVSGVKVAVPYAQHAARVLVSAVDASGAGSLVVIDPHGPGVVLTPQETSDGQPHAELVLEGAPVLATLGGADALAWLVEHATAARCMIQLGVVGRALKMTARYSRERVQFGRPIGAFQAVHQRAADAYIWVEAIRLTAWEAAWRLANELPATEEVAVAKYTAAEGGQFTAYACQHLHGGIGIDVDYPLHRYFIWAIQNEHDLGSARHQLSSLGRRIAAQGIPSER